MGGAGDRGWRMEGLVMPNRSTFSALNYVTIPTPHWIIIAPPLDIRGVVWNIFVSTIGGFAKLVGVRPLKGGLDRACL